MSDTPRPFNPLDMDHLAESVGNALLRSAPVPASAMTPFDGAGVYAIYFVGSDDPYGALGKANSGLAEGAVGVPIYVGKAVPPGSRKGTDVASGSRAVHRRLAEHRSSIVQAWNLDIAQFYFRWLIVEPIWIPLGESILIRKFSPVWNVVGDGFGKHAQGGNRSEELSAWDTLHPGRRSTPRGSGGEVYWADVSKPNKKSPSELQDAVREHLKQKLPPGSQTQVGLTGMEALPSIEAPEVV